MRGVEELTACKLPENRKLKIFIMHHITKAQCDLSGLEVVLESVDFLQVRLNDIHRDCYRSLILWHMAASRKIGQDSSLSPSP